MTNDMLDWNLLPFLPFTMLYNLLNTSIIVYIRVIIFSLLYYLLFLLYSFVLLLSIKKYFNINYNTRVIYYRDSGQITLWIVRNMTNYRMDSYPFYGTVILRCPFSTFPLENFPIRHQQLSF